MDEQLELATCGEGNQQSVEGWRIAQTVFYRQQEAWLRPLLTFFKLCPQQVEDAIQHVLLTIWLRMPLRMRTAKAFKERQHWIGTVAHNLAVDMLRENNRQPVSLPDELPTSAQDRGEEEETVGIDMGNAFPRLKDLMDELKEKNPLNYRLLYGRFFEDRKIHELAALERLTPHAVTNRIGRILLQFRKRLKDLVDEAGC